MRIIAGRWRGRILKTPPGRKTRPTTDRVREAWMSALQFDLPGARVLDLFAGAGALGIEALSRGAEHVTFVERARPVVETLRLNLQMLGALDEAELVRGDALDYARSLPAGAFDIALADPPYAQGLAAQLAEIFRASPFAAWLWVEHGANEMLPALPGLETRRYGATALTRVPAPE